jgi:hypothetical protein
MLREAKLKAFEEQSHFVYTKVGQLLELGHSQVAEHIIELYLHNHMDYKQRHSLHSQHKSRKLNILNNFMHILHIHIQSTQP